MPCLPDPDPTPCSSTHSVISASSPHPEHILDLPPEIFSSIAAHLDTRSLVALASTCSALHATVPDAISPDDASRVLPGAADLEHSLRRPQLCARHLPPNTSFPFLHRLVAWCRLGHLYLRIDELADLTALLERLSALTPAPTHLHVILAYPHALQDPDGMSRDMLATLADTLTNASIVLDKGAAQRVAASPIFIRARHVLRVAGRLTSTFCRLGRSPNPTQCLQHLHTLHLRGCEDLVDAAPLAHIRFLDLSFCPVLQHVSALGSGRVQQLSLAYCPRVSTADGLNAIPDLDLTACKISTASLSTLGAGRVCRLVLSCCPTITSARGLETIPTLDLSGCRRLVAIDTLASGRVAHLNLTNCPSLNLPAPLLAALRLAIPTLLCQPPPTRSPCP